MGRAPPGAWGTEVTHGAVDPQGEQHDEENHGPGRGQRERGQRLGVDDEDQPGPWKQTLLSPQTCSLLPPRPRRLTWRAGDKTPSPSSPSPPKRPLSWELSGHLAQDSRKGNPEIQRPAPYSSRSTPAAGAARGRGGGSHLGKVGGTLAACPLAPTTSVRPPAQLSCARHRPTHTCSHTHTLTHPHMHARVHHAHSASRSHMLICTRTHSCSHAHMLTCMLENITLITGHAHSHTCSYTHACAHSHLHMHAHTRSHMHACSCTHTHTLILWCIEEHVNIFPCR